MNIELNNETLTKYVLDELDPGEREAAGRMLQENEEAQTQAAELRASADLLQVALREGKDFALDDTQRTAILDKAGRASSRWGGIPQGMRRWAAVVLLAVGIGVPGVVFLGRNFDHQQRSPLSYMAEVEVGEKAPSRGMFLGERVSKLGLPWAVEEAPAAEMESLNHDKSFNGVSYFRGTELTVAQAPPQATRPAAPPAAFIDRYLIRNVSLAIEAVDVRLARTTIVQAAKDLGGYVSNLQESVDGLGRINITLQLRVPSAKLDALLPSVESIGKVLEKQLSTQDVTEEYIDTGSRIRNLRKAEERLIQHLDRTGELKDIVLIENELDIRREQIERLEGRINYLSNRVAFSTISVSIRETPAAESVTPAATFSTAKVLSGSIRDLVGAARTAWTGMIWAAVWSVVWAPVVLVLWAWGRRFGEWRRPRH